MLQNLVKQQATLETLTGLLSKLRADVDRLLVVAGAQEQQRMFRRAVQKWCCPTSLGTRHALSISWGVRSEATNSLLSAFVVVPVHNNNECGKQRMFRRGTEMVLPD